MKLKELRTRKYVALMIMILIVGAIVGILKIGNMDFDKGKVKVSKAVINNVTSSLSANVNEAAVDNLITSKGYDEIDYVIKYSLSTDENIKERNVIIEASLDDNEKYASFKDITNGDVISTVSENRKNIKITVKNAKVNKENELKLVMKLEGAPNGYKVTPKIKIKEVSEEKYTNLNVQNVEVKNNSLTGNVQDEQSMNVSNIELALKKDGETIKKTYTDEDGNYVFSDIEEGKYDLEIDEDIYEKVSEEKVNVSGSSKLNIVVKEVTPYKIELKKQITEMTIVNGGNATTYKYGNLDKVQQALRNVKNMTGEVKYKITAQNTGKKSGVVTVVKDEVPEGLTFNKEKNTSWEEKNGVLYNRSLEGITLNAGEKREEGLTLDIESTSEAKTYINKVTAKGEIYENIVYILDGKTYKEDTVLEGEKIKEPKVDNKDFKGWYTDKKYTNKYNFNNEVTKDLVLYGQTEEIKEYTVTYVDNEKIVKTEKVKENGSLTAPKVSKEGHTFKYWSEEPNGKEYDLNTKVTKDITLYSVYDINKYTVTFMNEKEKYDEQQVEYGGNIEVPTSPLKKYYTFKYWSLEENGDSYDLNTKVTKDITLYSVYDINKYTVTFIDKGKEIDKQELEAGSVVIAPKVSMEGYKFKYWSEKENGKEYNLNLPITRNLTLYSVYEINKYNVEFYDSNKLIKTIKVDYDNTINSNEVPTVSKIGYTFTGWIENNKNFDFTTKIKENKKLYSKYEIIKNAVIFNDENRITTKKVDYNNKVEKIESQGKTGYTFKYWSTTQDGEEFDFNTLITESITLYAVYEINEYSVNFIDQGDVYGDTQRVKYNNVAVKPETDPIKEGYTFKYWSLEENGVAYDFNTKITKNTTLYSVYSVNNYKVSFVDNGTKYIEDETIEYNKTAIKPETDPSKVGHTFKYWSLEENGVAYDFNTKITKDITLYSVYSVNSYKVSFINEGTKYIEDETIEYNKVALKPETDPSKVGHTFKYWSLEENGIAYDFNTKITKDTILYSVYEANEYTVKFMNGDNLFKQEQVKYGLKATKPSENPTREHNLFKTWTLNDKEYDFNLPVTDNLVLHSKYEEIEKPSISHVPTKWTNNKVTVTITSSHEDYKYLYKIDTGEYKEYTGPFDIDYNCTVVAKSVKENVDSITESHDITNIDKIKPIINSLNEINVSGTSFDINVSTIDNESGMKQIHIYKDDLLETTIVYNENYNEEKNSTYTFNDLTSGNDYKIKVIAEDVAGNLSEAKEITVKTEEKIVARIIGRENKLFEDENLYENFSSLERAIKACPSNQCTIEMVTDTKESVEVLEGQDITLNINGKTITGVKDTYTINNGGNLIIKDNVEETGSIVNNAGVALKNETTGVLTLGELEDELVVSTTKPYINGGTFGVVNEYIDKNTKGRFNFYDGMIAGNVAIEGEVNDKPYLYNASVVTSDNRQVATLKILEDAEARIIRTGVYYTKVNEAIEDTNKGTYTEPTTTNTTLMNGFKTNTMYGFTYDSETNTLSSESNRTSKSYTTIDLTGYENDQYLYITSKELSSTYGNFSITVKENDSNGTSINQTKTYDNTTGQNNYKFTLSKGKRYYVELIYKINSETEDNKVVISNISLQKINRYGVTEDTEFKSLSNTYSFEYDEATRTLRSNNQYTKYTTAFSYIEVDLTNEQEDKEVIINASLDTLSYSNYGNIVINEDNSKLSGSSSSALAYMYVNGYSNTSSSQTFVGPYNYSKRLEKGKKYYIQFYYFKGYDNYSESKYKEYDSKDQFIINTIDIVGVGNKEDIDLSTNLKTNYYGFDNYDSYYNQYRVQSDAPSDEKFDSYVKIDLTKSKVDQMIDLNLKLNNYSSIYITSNNKDSGKNLIINNMRNTLLSFYLYYDYYINGNSHWSSFYDYKYVLPKGSVYYVHFAGYNPDGRSGASIKSISLIPITNNMINIGKLPHLKGTIDDSGAVGKKDYVTDDGTKDSNFRFIGKNTKNYVKFNNELWRVIGIFNTTDADGNYAKRIKIVRNDSIGGGIVWDSSSSKVNSGNGVNEWSQSAVMKLLNPGYENNKVTHDSGSEIVTNNSLYWNKTSGSCLSSGGLSTSSCDFTSIGLSDSSKLMIDSVLWNTGAITNDTQNITPNQMYIYERGDKTGKTNFDASNYPTVDSVDRTTTWFGKVGLPYPSDYVMASGNGSGNIRSKCMDSNSNIYGDCSSNNNWMGVNLSSPLMTMSPVYGAAFPSFTTSMITSLYTMPAVNNNYVLKPSVYLNPKIKITSGNGSQNDPFILELGEEENKMLYYGLVPDLIKDDNKEEETEISDEAETLDYTYVKKETIYGFTYDEERGVFTNDNKGIANTTAISYIKIDLTNAASDMPINLSYKLSKSDYDSMGFLHLMKNNLNKINYNDSTSYSKGDTIFASGTKSYSDTKAITLEKGNVYYLQFAYKKEGKLPVSSTNEDKFEVGITYSTNNDITDDYTKYDESVPTLNKESDTVQILKDLLLTNSLNIENTRSMILDLNGHVISTVVDDYVIKNSGDLTVIDSKYYSDVEDQDKADENKQIEYNNEYKNSISKYSNSNYSYTINDYEKNGLKVNLDGIEHGDDATSWKDSSENNNTGIINGSAEFGTNYLNFDGVDDYIDLGKHNYENITFETVLDGNTGKIKTILYNMSNGGYQLRLSNLANSITFNYKSTATASRSLPTSFSKVIDKVYYAVTYDGEKIKTYVNGILVKTSSSKIYFADNDSSLLIGAGRNGTDLQNFYSGKIFTTRIYNRALTENEIEKNYLVDKNRYEFSNRGLTSSSTTATSDSGVDAYKAFDSDTNTSWYSESNDEASITYSSTERTLLKFRIYGDTDKSMYPKSVELLGSKDGINYVSVLISNLESKGLNEYNEIKISPDVNDSYKYFKWNLRNPGNKIAIGEIKLDFVDITRKIVTFKSSTLVPSGTISSSSNSVIYNESGANLNIKEGKVTLTKSGNYNAITNLGNLSLGSLSIINSSATAIYNDTNSQATINSKSISSNQYGIYNNTDRNLTLDIGSISSSGYFIYNSGGGKLDVSAKTVNTTNGIYNTGVEDSTINVITSNDKNDFLYNIGSGKIDLHAKTISGNIQNNAKGNIDAEILSKANKISNNDDGVINIKADAATVSGGIYNNGSGNITAAVSILNQGLYNEKIGNITATIGKIESKNIGIENVDAGTVDATIDTIRITKNSKDSTGNAYGIINSGTGVITANVSTISLNASRTMGQNRAVYNVKSGNIYLDAKTISLSNIATGSVRGSIASVGIYNASKGLIEVKNAEIIVKDTSGGGSYYGNAAIYSGSSGTINFFNGTITGCFNYGIWNSSTGVVDLGDKFDMDIYEQGIKNERGTIKIKNGNITSANKVVENNSGNISIDDSVFKNSSNVSDLIIYNLYGTITINNSSMPGTVDNNGSGTITINNGKVNGYIYNKGTFNINSGKHSVVDLDNGGGVTNSGKLTITDATLNGSVDNSGTLNINNSTLESYFNDAITTSGTVNITKGKIIGGYGGIRAFDGTVTLGQKDGVVDKESVIIRGATFGIYDNGDGSNENYAKFNFYDGVITGKSNKAIDAAISDAEDGYDLYSYTNSDNSDLVDITLEIPNKETLGDVAEVDGVKYPSIKSAFDSISSEENKTIKLLKDTSTILNISESNKNITIDTNGKKIRYYSDKEYIINHNSLEISDIKANKTAGIYSVYSTIVDNYGSLSVKGVNADYLTSKKSTIKNNDSCIVNIDAGVSSKWNAINNTSTGIVNVNSGTISSSSSYGNTIKNENGTINIKKVTVSSSKNSIENNLGEVNIMDSDANISGNLAIHNISGTVKMMNGKVTGTIGIKNDSNGNLIIEDGTIESVGNGIESSGKLQMNSGSISAQQAGIYLSDNSLSTINGGTIIPNRVGQIGINVSGSSILNINDGSVTGFGKGILVDGTLNLGTKGDIDSDGMLVVSKDSPNITASDIAIDINSNGIFNFYDGRITGKTAISGSVNEIEDNYQIILERNTSNDEIKYLDKKMIVKNLTTEEEYNDLQKAINDASIKDTLQLINSITFMSSDEINISNDKNIILDLNGKEIYVSGSSNIKNLGVLKIIDSTNKKNTDGSVEYENGKIVTLNKKLFENSGELILDAIVLSSGDNGTGSLIMNDTNGSLSLVNSKITTSSSSLIYNNSDNELNIENSIIDIKGEYILYNNSSSDININSSNITAKCNISECRYINNLSTGSITIEDSTISTNGQGSSIYNENGYKIDIKNSTISTSDKNYIIYNIGGSIINLTGSKLNTPKRYSWYSLYNEADNTINIKSSTLKSLKNQSSSSVVNVFSGEITYIGNSGTLNVGTESTSEDAVEDSDNPFIRNVENSGVFNFYSGTLNNDLLSSDYERKILLSSSSEFNMYGGTIIAYSDVAINASNKINLYNGTIKNSNGIGIKLTGENTKLINENCVVSATTGVEVTKDTTATIENIIINNSTTGIVTYENSTLNLKNSTITTNDGYAIDNSGVLNVESGNIESINSTGIYNNSGTISIGIKGDKDSDGNNITSITNPSIKGKDYGINSKYASDKNISFYDGVIKGEHDLILIFNEIETNYDVFITTDNDNNKVYYLKSEKLLKNLSTNKEYYDLQDAIDESSDGDTLQFIRSKKYYQYNIPSSVVNEDKDIILDINGNVIETSGYYNEYITNNGKLKIIDGKNSFDGNGIITSGTGKIYHDQSISMSGGDIVKRATLIVNYGTLDISGGLLESANGSNMLGFVSGSITLNSGGITGKRLYSNQGTSFNINGGKIDVDIISGPTSYNIKSGTINSSDINTYNTVNIYGGTINSTNINVNTMNMLGGIITSNITGNTINISDGTVTGTIKNFSKLNVGIKDDIVNTITPSITNVESEYTVNGVNKVGEFNFYDGKIVSIKGRINEVQPGYKVVNSDGYNILMPLGDDERVAMVNGINFGSLQAAINSVKDNTESNIVIYKDIELTEDIIVPENKIINLYLNGHTITYGDYNFVKNGTLTIIDSAPSESIGASIINTIEKVLNINQNGKNIIVYEMSDGSKLSTENTYNLYKKVDNEYKLLNMEKDEEVGRYISGSNNSEMTSIKGRIYLNNLEEGSYKLVSSDNKDIEFTITEDGKLNGNILENTNEKRKVIETAFAYLIITIQTGVNQIKYIIYIVAIVSIILGLYFAFKEQRKLSRKV